MAAPTIIAEIGGNHRGEMDTARRMVEIVGRWSTEHFGLGQSIPEVRDGFAPIKAYVKFQKRTCDLVHYPSWTKPHPNPAFAYGPTYLDHRRALEFDMNQHRILKEWAQRCGTGYSCSVWDLSAAREIASLDPDWIKVPSAANLDLDLLSVLVDEYGGGIHISLGMTRRSEVYKIVDFMRGAGGLGRTVLYACTSDYPANAHDTRGGELEWLQSAFGSEVAGIGFSGHHAGIAIDMAATALGAQFIERHFTLDRSWKGTDHAASLEPAGLRKLMRDVQVVSAALGKKPDTGLLDCEMGQREKLKSELGAASP